MVYHRKMYSDKVVFGKVSSAVIHAAEKNL